MTGRIRRFYFAVGLIVFLLLTLALLAASYRAAPEGGVRDEPERMAPDQVRLSAPANAGARTKKEAPPGALSNS